MSTHDSIEKRIKEAEETLLAYPQWVRENNYFQGGEKTREGSLVAKPQARNESSGTSKSASRSRAK
jgi:hypothetical protein